MTEKYKNELVDDIEFELRLADKKLCELHAWILFLRKRNAVSSKKSTSDLRVINRIRERLMRLEALMKCLENVPESWGVFQLQEE